MMPSAQRSATGDILCVVGARPNLMKIAPVLNAFSAAGVPARLVHTGQHYDAEMNQQFFAELGIAAPDVNLEVCSGSHAVQTAEIMRRFEPVLDAAPTAGVLVVGDVNSTVACALVAAKKAVPVIHVEAGLRSYDRRMPEEINRLLTDQLADLLFTTERRALDNLVREGVDPARVHFVGNVMIDTLHANLKRAVPAVATLRAADLDPGKPYAVLTLHRPSNVDERDGLAALLEVMAEIARELQLVFPVHPRTRGKIEQHGLGPMLKRPGIAVLPPVGYLEILGLLQSAKLALTDSGGIQEETTALGVPCITLRDNTERPVTATEGTNTIVGSDPAKVRAAFRDVMAGGGKAGRIPELWDGRAAPRIAAVLRDWLGAQQGSLAA